MEKFSMRLKFLVGVYILLVGSLLLPLEAFAGHTITGLNPSSGNNGQTFPLTITGTDFVNGATVTVGTGLSVSGTTVVYATTITTTLTISATAPTGPNIINVVQGPQGGHQTGPGTFTVNAAAAPGGSGAGFQKQTLPAGPTTADSLLETITKVMNWVFTVFIIIATLFIILAGFKFVTGGEKGIGEARSMLMWAVVGIVIAVIAWRLPFVIKSTLFPGG